MSASTLTLDGRAIPRFLYGTAWKELQTARLAEMAISAGFRGIDTANQRRHYVEAAVGQAISVSIARGIVTREELFLQSKFTFAPGQDHRLPYDPQAPVATQVAQSFANSLEHLGTDALDSYVLHGPTRRAGLGAADWEAWRAMESLQANEQVRWLGISNVTPEQVDELCQRATIRPRFVQNRCYAAHRWDRAMRELCGRYDIVYQGFSLLTANRGAMAHPELARLSNVYGCSISQLVFRFALDAGMIPLTGTSSADHMRADLEVFDFELDPADIARIEGIAAI